MSTIKMQQAYLAELRKTVLTAGNHSNAAYRAVSKAMDGLSDMQFSAKASTVEELFTLRQRLDRLQHNGITYSQLIEEYADQLQAIDDGTNETSDTILSRLSSQTGTASTSRFSFSGAAKLAQQSATAGLFLGGAGLLSGITKIGKGVWDAIKGWIGKLNPNNSSSSIPPDERYTTELSYRTKIDAVLEEEMSNQTSCTAQKYWSWYYGSPSKRSDGWCAVFVSNMMEKAGINVNAPVQNGSTWFKTSPEYQLKYFNENGCYRPKEKEYSVKVGDLVFYEGFGGGVGHVAIVSDIKDGKIMTIHGNAGSPTIIEIPETWYCNNDPDKGGYCKILGYGDVGAFSKI